MVKKQNKEELKFTYPQEEKPDWGYARDRSFALKRTNACWSYSLFTVEHEDFLLPGRDYSQQGLAFRNKDEYTKFLDAVMFKLLENGRVVDLEPMKAEVTPWRATYFYENDDTELKVTYYLAQDIVGDKAGGWVRFEVESDADEIKVIASPLIDIREVEGESPEREDYETEERDGCLLVSKDGKEIGIGPSNGTEINQEDLSFNYRLEYGYREVRHDEGRFRGKEKKPTKMGEVSLDLSENKDKKLAVACGSDVTVSDLKLFREKTMDNERGAAENFLGKFKVPGNGLKERFLKARLLTLPKFSIKEGGLEVPEAGEWWFKEVWFRDLFEAIYHNTDFYRTVEGDEWIKKILTWAKVYLEDGMMPGRISGGELNYKSVDAPLLYLLCAAKYYEATGDEELKENMESTFKSIIQNLPNENGLISCRPEYSWMDSTVEGESTRIPESWDMEDEENFLLPEVNALWIKVLEKYNKIYDGAKNVKETVDKYKEVFWNEEKEFIYQLVYRGDDKELKDFTESSAGVVSIALLGDYFFGYEIRNAWEVIKNRLLVWRKPVFFDEGMMPFGVLTKNSNERIYMDDRQYHEAVVWPRDLPYLFKILERIGRDSVKEEITKNLLDHQMSEGTVLYNHELFSLPEGENPREGALSSNPVPVKNPMQLWSHFIPDIVEVNE